VLEITSTPATNKREGYRGGFEADRCADGRPTWNLEVRGATKRALHSPDLGADDVIFGGRTGIHGAGRSCPLSRPTLVPARPPDWAATSFTPKTGTQHHKRRRNGTIKSRQTLPLTAFVSVGAQCAQCQAVGGIRKAWK